MTFEQWLQETFSMELASLSDAQKTKFQAIFDAEMGGADEDDSEETEAKPEEEPAAMNAGRKHKKSAPRMRAALGGDGASLDGSLEERIAKAVDKASRLESARISRIRALAGDHQEIADKAILDGTDVKDFELATLRAGRTSRSHESSNDNDDVTPQVYEAALLLHTNMAANRVAKYFNEEIMNRAMSKDMQGFSLVECGDRLIRRAGVGFKGNRKQEAHMAACRDASAKLRASGFSGFTISSILENVADKTLLTMYQEVITMWKTFCAIRSLNDFKIHSSYALDPTNVFRKVGTQGDFDQLKFSDRKYNLQAESYGLRFKIDYPTWRNDDLGSISDRIGAVGQLGASTIEQVVFALLMSGLGNALMFHANNGNYLVNNASYALGIAGMTAAETAIENQVRPNNTPLGVAFNTLLVTPTLKSAAGALYTSTKLNETTTADKSKASDNPFVGRYTPNVSPYLSNTVLKTNDGTAFAKQDPAWWMLFAQSGNNAAINVGFLDGQQTPSVAVMPNPVEMIGFELATSMHFGVGYGDPKMAMALCPNNP